MATEATFETSKVTTTYTLSTGARGPAGPAVELGPDDNYVTDAEKTKLSNLSGTNTGDETAARISALGWSGYEATMRGKINSAEIVPGAVGRYLGIRTFGPPTSGAYTAGDWTISNAGDMWVCVSGGSPGKWIAAGSDAIRRQVPEQFPSMYEHHMIYPAPVVQTNFTTYNQRCYFAPMPLSENVFLNAIRLDVKVAGNAGSTLQIGVYSDHRGFPGWLITSGSIDTASTGVKTATLAEKVPGGQRVWIGLLVKDAATTAPTFWHFTFNQFGFSARTDSIYYPEAAGYKRDSLTSLPQKAFNTHYIDTGADKIPTFSLDFTIRTPDIYQQPKVVPLVLPTEDYHQNTLQEPNIVYDATRAAAERYVLVCTYGFLAPGLCWFTAPSMDGPWTNKGKLWDGASGKSSVYVESGTIYVYTAGLPVKMKSGASFEAIAASATVDDVTFTNTSTISTGIQNTYLVKRGTGDYMMRFDSQHTSNNVGVWQGGYATGSSPLGPFAISDVTWYQASLRPLGISNALTSAGHLTYDAASVGSEYKLWYHGSTNANSPNDIYHAVSTDGINWTIDNSGKPIIQMVWHPISQDQAADPCFFRDPVSGLGYVAYTAFNNTQPFATILITNPNVLTVSE